MAVNRRPGRHGRQFPGEPETDAHESESQMAESEHLDEATLAHGGGDEPVASLSEE
jgi:hypothetical protein